MSSGCVVSREDFLKTYKNEKFAKRALNKYSKWLPLCSSDILARIVANVLCDGNLEVRKIGKTHKYDYLGFYSKNITELKEFNDDIYKLFGLKGTIRKWGKREYGFSMGCIISNSAIVRILKLCGVPANEKVSVRFSIPQWITEGNNKIKTSFLRAAFSCEGSVTFDISDKSWEIRFSSNKLEALFDEGIRYLNSYRCLLKKFDIATTNVFEGKTTLRTKDRLKSIEFCFKIQKPESVLKYAEHIGFNNKDKKVKLVEAIKWARIRAGKI